MSYKAGSGKTEYSHATLANVTGKINASLSAHGLSAAWETHQENGSVSVTCRITHVKGHSEETTLTASPDTSGSKNPIQAIGSTISYLERYTVLALTGLASKDMDDDGEGSGAEVIDEKQFSQITDMLNDLKAKDSAEKAMLKFAGVDAIENIATDKFDGIVIALERRKEKENVKS